MNYECTFICSPDLPAEKVEELISKTTKIVETSKGSIKSVQQLGKKKLAYPISKFREGNYVFMEFNSIGDTINKMEAFFKLNDGVIRFLTIKLDPQKEKAKEKARAKAKEREQAKAKAAEAPKESSENTEVTDGPAN
jgi:small subunit ribosomal protein S6